MVKAKAITQAQVDAREAEELAEREQNEAIATIRDQQKTIARLVLALTTTLWPKLTQQEKASIREALPDEDERKIKAALSRLYNSGQNV